MKCLSRFLIAALLLITSYTIQGQCGNKSSHGVSSCGCETCPEPPTGDPFNPFTGNEHREVHDIQLWGSVGDIPMIWKRYYNSREFRVWTYSFHYNMTDAGLNAQGQQQLSIYFPEGGWVTFTQSANNPSVWLPIPGVGEQLFQQGNNYIFQRPNGHRYRFEKLTDAGGVFYQLREIRDTYQNVYALQYNADRALTRVTEPAGRYFAIDYTSLNGEKFIHHITTSDGRSVQYNYSVYTDGSFSWVLLTGVNYGDGTAATYSYHQPHYSGPGFVYLEHAIDPRYSGANVNMKFTYNNAVAHGYIKQEINGKTGEVMVTLNADWRNRWVCYANGRVQHLVMPAEQLGKPEEYVDGLGRKKQYSYDANGFSRTTTDPAGRITTFTRTIYGNPSETIHKDGSVEKWVRDDLELPLKYTDMLNRVTTYTRDAFHRITATTHPDGTTEHFTYNTFGQILSHTLRNGGTEHYTYDARGLKTSFSDALGNSTVYTYDAADRMASVTDARGNIIRYEYNERGLLTKLTQADNSYMLYTYDDFGNRTSVTNEIGNTWAMVFDEFKRMVNKTDPLNRTTTYAYTLPGGGCGCAHDRDNPTQITYPGGRITKMEYDMEWQKIKETTGAGSMEEATTFYEYNITGYLTTIIDPRMKVWKYEYDEMGRMKRKISPLGHAEERTYDKAGNILATIRPDNGIIQREYDNMNRMVQSIDPKGQVTKMQYDNSGNMIKLTDANNQPYHFEYDLLNRKTKMIYPGGSFERNTYDAVSNLLTYTNRAGAVRTYTYDSRNRQTHDMWSDATPATSVVYDAAGRLLSLTSSVSTLSYTYNQANELTGENQAVQGAPAWQVNYTYNADGLKNSMNFASSATVINYDYTSRNQMSSISVNGTSLASYGYDANGNKVAIFRNNGVGTSYNYDDDNHTLTITHQKAGIGFAHFEYGYDNADRRSFVRRNYAKGDVYGYDATDQLINVRYEVSNPQGIPGGAARTVDYTYDASGNRVVVNDNGTNTGYSANALNQYTSIGGSALTHNINGDLETFNGWAYTYDAQGRLTTATKGSITAVFAYDARNRCVKRTINGTTAFLYYDMWKLAEETNSSGAVSAQYIHGPDTDEILLAKTPSHSVFHHHDALGNVTHLTDAGGSVVEQYAYDVFGKAVIKNGSGILIAQSGFSNRFLFTGREFISEIGLYDYRNRMYSAEAGRFLQTDPLRFKGKDYNLYRYVRNNPVNMRDPDGLLPEGKTWGGILCRAACWTVAGMGCAAVSCLCAAGTVVTVGTISIPCTVAIIAACGAAGGLASVCGDFCPD
ncbi:MAG: RHS repeat-associated core domain-containing protein [Chitinophagaceae bacterium]